MYSSEGCHAEYMKVRKRANIPSDSNELCTSYITSAFKIRTVVVPYLCEYGSNAVATA